MTENNRITGMLSRILRIVFFVLVIHPVFAQEGTPEKSLPKEKGIPELKNADTIPVPGSNTHEKVLADMDGRMSELEKKISQLESEAIERKMETKQSYLEELNELKVAKDLFKVKLNELRTAPERELDELENEALKSLDELEKTYQNLVSEINKDKPGL